MRSIEQREDMKSSLKRLDMILEFMNTLYLEEFKTLEECKPSDRLRIISDLIISLTIKMKNESEYIYEEEDKENSITHVEFMKEKLEEKIHNILNHISKEYCEKHKKPVNFLRKIHEA